MVFELLNQYFYYSNYEESKWISDQFIRLLRKF